MKPYILGDIFSGEFNITQRFGVDPAYYGQFGLRGHEGVDFATPVGTPILAPFNGIVLRENWQQDYRNYGIVVVVWDPVQKVAAWFAHLSSETVYVGQLVKKGQILGATGNTGNSTGQHLHFGIVETDAYGNRLNGNNGYIGFVDPLNPSIVKWQINESPNADEYVKRAEDAAKSLYNAVEAGSRVNDPLYVSKMSNVKSKITNTLKIIE